MSLVCPYLTSSLNQRWLSFLAIDMSCYLINGITSLENDVIDLTHSVSLALDRLVYLLLLSSWLIHVPITMRLCNSRIPEEHLVCYQTSQRNWVIIKVLYRCLRWFRADAYKAKLAMPKYAIKLFYRCLQWYLLSCHRSRLGYVTPIVGKLSLGPLGNAHHYNPCKQCD